MPSPNGAARCLKPTPWGVGRYLLLLLPLLACGIFLVADAQNPADRAKGLGSCIMFGTLTILLLVRAATGGMDLYLTQAGFRLGKRSYDWANIGSGFRYRRGLKLTVSFTNAGKRAALPNVYAVSTPEFASLLNSYLPHSPSAPSFGLPRRDTLTPAQPARRKTLPLWAWPVIVTVFLVTLQQLGPITAGLWSIFAPVSYAAHTLDDYTLANRAGHDPSLLPVLLAREAAGDRAADFYLGDLYDPTDFKCETTVPKSAANAIIWYRRGIARDDQGAERALGYFYLKGIGAPQNDNQAAALLERAVTHNDDLADYYLGTMLETGQGEPQNLPRALALETASAAQGDTLGQDELGRMYFAGIGIPPNRAKAQAEWDAAAAQGDSTAQGLLTENGMQ